MASPTRVDISGRRGRVAVWHVPATGQLVLIGLELTVPVLIVAWQARATRISGGSGWES